MVVELTKTLLLEAQADGKGPFVKGRGSAKEPSFAQPGPGGVKSKGLPGTKARSVPL